MAKQEINEQALYRVVLTKSVPVGRAQVHAGTVRLRGDALKAAQAAGAVKSFEPIEA